MIRTVRDALRLVDSWTRRKVGQAVLIAVGMAVLETLAFGLLYALLTKASPGVHNNQNPTGGILGLLHLERASTGTLSAVCVALLLTKSVVAAFVARWQTDVQAKTDARLATRIFRDYLRRPLLFHVDRNSAQSVAAQTAYVGTLSMSVIGGIITVTTESLVLASIFAALLLVEPVLALCIALYVVVVAWIYIAVLSRYVSAVAERFYRLHTEMLQAMQEGLGGIKGIQALDVTDKVSDRYALIREVHAEANARMSFAQRLPQYYLEVCSITAIATCGLVVAYAGVGNDPYAVIGLLIVAALRVLPAGNRLLGALSGLRLGEAAVRPLYDDHLEDIRRQQAWSNEEDQHPTGELPRLRHALTLEGVTFSYPRTKRAALDDVHLVIQSGESVGIVGQSGAGKTTLVDVLLGLLKPQIGALAVDGVRVTPQNMALWRRQVAYVPQDTFLMDASIRENVIYYRSEHGRDDREVWRALDDAMLGDFVRELPNGLDTTVGERGARLSGGQRQRLGIARALLQRPQVLLLDEATSALDGSTEAAITETVRGLKGRVTVATIAHRLSTVRGCDRLILMSDGRVIDQGPFEELVGRSADFAEMAARAGL